MVTDRPVVGSKPSAVIVHGLNLEASLLAGEYMPSIDRLRNVYASRQARQQKKTRPTSLSTASIPVDVCADDASSDGLFRSAPFAPNERTGETEHEPGARGAAATVAAAGGDRHVE